MTDLSRVGTRNLACVMVLGLVLASGCENEKSPTSVEPGPRPGPAAGPIPGTSGVARSLDDMKNDVKPPVVVKPE